MEAKEKKDLNGVLLLGLIFLLGIHALDILMSINYQLPEYLLNSKFIQNITSPLFNWGFKLIYLILIPALFRIYILVDIAKKLKKEDQPVYRQWYYIVSILVLIGAVHHKFFFFYNVLVIPMVLFLHIFLGSRGFAKISQGLDEETPLATVNQKPLKEMGLIFPTDKGPLHVHNVFQGTLVSGGAGAGKSASVIEPAITQWARQNMSMTIYDFKGDPPTLGLMAYNVWLETTENTDFKKPEFQILSFDQLHNSIRPNPLKPSELKSGIDTKAITTTLLLTLKKEWVTKKDFWAESAMNLCYAIAERLRKEPKYHRYCTIPHLVVLSTMNAKDLITWLRQDFEIRNVISSFITAMDAGADSQIGGMFSSLQSPMAELMQKELFWIFGAEQEEQATLNLNDPQEPKILVLANNPTKQKVISPLLSCCIRAIINQVNQQGKHPHAMVIDELPTVYIEDLSALPATARSNKVASMFGIQDESQLQTQYDKQADEIIANLANSFIGMTNNPKTAKKYSDYFGTYAKKKTSYSTSDNSLSFSDSLQNEKILQERDIANQPVGHFIGKIADGDPAFFSAQIDYFDKENAVKDWKKSIELPYTIDYLESLSQENKEMAQEVFNDLVEMNYLRIFHECEELLINEINQQEE